MIRVSFLVPKLSLGMPSMTLRVIQSVVYNAERRALWKGIPNWKLGTIRCPLAFVALPKLKLWTPSTSNGGYTQSKTTVTRNPIILFFLFFERPIRVALRQNAAPLFHEPPRTIRYPIRPPSSHTRSSDGAFL
jgi:hypothetical protein